MPRFSRREADVIALADTMIAAYTTSPGDFPNADLPALQTARGEFNEWHQVGVAFESELTVTGEPRGRQLEHRVIAISACAQFVGSKTVVVL